MIRSRARRLTSGVLLLGFYLALIAPALTLYAAEAKMSCCKRSRGLCCKMHQKQRTETGWVGGSECSRPCGENAVSPQTGDSLVAVSASGAVDSAIQPLIFQPEAARSRSTSYLAFLYQLPPPALAR